MAQQMHGIHGAHHMNDVAVLEAAHDLDDRVGLANVGEELVAEALAFGRSFHKPGDVDELDDGRHDLLGLHDVRKPMQPVVRHLDHANVRLDGAERIVRRLGAGGRESVEESGLADVGKTDDSEFQHERKLMARRAME